MLENEENLWETPAPCFKSSKSFLKYFGSIKLGCFKSKRQNITAIKVFKKLITFQVFNISLKQSGFYINVGFWRTITSSSPQCLLYSAKSCNLHTLLYIRFFCLKYECMFVYVHLVYLCQNHQTGEKRWTRGETLCTWHSR